MAAQAATPRGGAGVRRLVAQGVGVAIGGRAVLRGVSVAVERGEVVALVGPSGAGKSTLLWAMAGLRGVDAGRVYVDAKETQAEVAGAPKAVLRAGRFGVALQPAGLWEHLSAGRHLDLVLRGLPIDRAERRRRAAAALDAFGIGGLERRRPGAMSAGERQRLSLARAVVVEPDWLLLDEPTAHLDFAHRGAVLDRLRDTPAARRAGVLMVTHHGAEAMGVADRVGVLLDGELVQLGTPEDVYDAPVSLDAARLLGEASELRGVAEAGELRIGGEAVAAVGPGLRGEVSLVLRPGRVAFEPGEGGPWRVERSERRGEARRAVLVHAGRGLRLVTSDAQARAGLSGSVRVSGP